MNFKLFLKNGVDSNSTIQLKSDCEAMGAATLVVMVRVALGKHNTNYAIREGFKSAQVCLQFAGM